MTPKITLTGAASSTSRDALRDLASNEGVEIGLLFTLSPEGRDRYPSYNWLRITGEALYGKQLALHVCGSAARRHLASRVIDDLVFPFQRIQVNGIVPKKEIEAICDFYPLKTIITQHSKLNAELLDVKNLNHALLVDGSGGRGVSPLSWERPATRKEVGFAGGLGPDNLFTELSKIERVATGSWWVDMEQKLRTENDEFSCHFGNRVVAIIRSWASLIKP